MYKKQIRKKKMGINLLIKIKDSFIIKNNMMINNAINNAKIL